LEVDFVIRYKGECTLVEVKAVTGNALADSKDSVQYWGAFICSQAMRQRENICSSDLNWIIPH